MNMENEKLKSCPFCGGEAMFKTHEDSCDPSGWSSVVRCKDCHIEVWGDEDDAINKWNRRNYPEKQDSSNLTYADVERMVKPLEWELECENGDSVAKVGKALFRISYWDNEAKYIVFCNTTIIKGGFTLLDEAKYTAQEFLVDFIAAALGVKRSGK